MEGYGFGLLQKGQEISTNSILIVLYFPLEFIDSIHISTVRV